MQTQIHPLFFFWGRRLGTVVQIEMQVVAAAPLCHSLPTFTTLLLLLLLLLTNAKPFAK